MARSLQLSVNSKDVHASSATGLSSSIAAGDLVMQDNSFRSANTYAGKDIYRHKGASYPKLQLLEASD